MNSEFEFIVATPAIFLRGRELDEVMGHFYENGRLKVDAALRRGDPGAKLIAARRSAPTLPARPSFHRRW